MKHLIYFSLYAVGILILPLLNTLSLVFSGINNNNLLLFCLKDIEKCNIRVGIKKKVLLCAKRDYDRDMMINKCLRFYDLKSNKRYIFFMNSNIKLQFSSWECKSKAIFKLKKCVHAMFLSFFILMYNNID